MKEIYDLQKGDFVVHIDHGVGEFSENSQVPDGGSYAISNLVAWA